MKYAFWRDSQLSYFAGYITRFQSTANDSHLPFLLFSNHISGILVYSYLRESIFCNESITVYVNSYLKFDKGQVESLGA